MYMHADTAYKEALEVVKQLKQELAEDTSLRVCVDIQAESSHRLVFDGGLFKAVNVESVEDQVEVIKNGITWAFEGAGKGTAIGKTMIIISGHGTGILTPTFMGTLSGQASPEGASSGGTSPEGAWEYEKDEGPSPCKEYCTSQYEEFCKQVTQIMDGKSLLTAGHTSFLGTDELGRVMKYAAHVLGRPVDIIGFDSCYMAMLEIAYEVAPYARYMVASQESEEKDGWNYHDVIRALKNSEPLEAARKLVYSYERTRRLRGADRFSLTAFDLSLVPELALTLDYLSGACRTEKLLGALCATRTRLHKISGIPMYADLTEFVEELLVELDVMEATPVIDQIKILAVRLLEQLHLLLPAVGSSCGFLQGCSVYFPTAHIDSSYKGTFVQEHGWCYFLKFFTGNEDTVENKVVVRS